MVILYDPACGAVPTSYRRVDEESEDLGLLPAVIKITLDTNPEKQCTCMLLYFLWSILAQVKGLHSFGCTRRLRSNVRSQRCDS